VTVLYISQLGVNLVSLSLLQRSGSTIRSLNNRLTVVYMGEDLLHAMMNGEKSTLYFVNSSNYIVFIMSSENMCLWHHHIDHLSPSLISTMSCCKMVKKLKLNSPLAFNHLCSSCMYGKSHKLLLSNSSSLSYSKIELVVMDLIGLMSRSLMVDSVFIFSFFLNFIFHFLFFYFSIFRTTRVRVCQSHCHISHKLMV